MATRLTPWVFAAAHVKQMLIQMAFATMWTTAWAPTTNVVCATAQARSTSAVAPTFLKETAIAMATCSTSAAFAAVKVFLKGSVIAMAMC